MKPLPGKTRHDDDRDDRTARLPRAVRDATVTGTEDADEADTTTDPALPHGKRRSGGPGGYAPTVVPDSDDSIDDEGEGDGEVDGYADAAEDRRRPPPLHAQGQAWNRDAQATNQSLADIPRRPTKENR